MNFKIGDFVLYKNSDLKICENCLIVSLFGNSYKLKTVEVLDDCNTQRYFDEGFNALDRHLTLITDEQVLNRLRKLTIFK